MTRLLLLSILLVLGCAHHKHWPYVDADGRQAYIVKTHICKLVEMVPDRSNIFPDQHFDQLWDCGDYGKMWILVTQEQP